MVGQGPAVLSAGAGRMGCFFCFVLFFVLFVCLFLFFLFFFVLFCFFFVFCFFLCVFLFHLVYLIFVFKCLISWETARHTEVLWSRPL